MLSSSRNSIRKPLGDILGTPADRTFRQADLPGKVTGRNEFVEGRARKPDKGKDCGKT